MKSLLIVDDDQDILNLFKHYLKESGHEVEFLTEPKEVLDKLKFKKFDLIVTDVLMPSMNGIDLTKLIKAEYPDIKILVCSEGGTTDAREIVAGIVMNKAIDFGALYALKKPFKKKELIDTIEAVLNGDIENLAKI